jgi:hypothetical protein
MAEPSGEERKSGGVVYRRPRSEDAMSESLTRAVLAIPGVTGLHRSVQDPAHEVVVLVTDEFAAAALPDQVEGFKVRAKISGRLRSF